MADGVTTQTSSLATIPDATKIATDDAGSAGHVQLVKLAVSTDGSATALTADADGLLVNLGANNDVTVTGTVLPTPNTTAAVTSVADTATSTTLLSAAGTRRGFRITNTSSAVLYVKYGTTASATDFTVRLPQWAYLEENFFSGRVDGIWSSDPGDGAALITSLSA